MYHGHGAFDVPIMGGDSKERIDTMTTPEAAEIITNLQDQWQSAQGTNRQFFLKHLKPLSLAQSLWPISGLTEKKRESGVHLDI